MNKKEISYLIDEIVSARVERQRTYDNAISINNNLLAAQEENAALKTENAKLLHSFNDMKAQNEHLVDLLFDEDKENSVPYLERKLKEVTFQLGSLPSLNQALQEKVENLERAKTPHEKLLKFNREDILPDKNELSQDYITELFAKYKVSSFNELVYILLRNCCLLLDEIEKPIRLEEKIDELDDELLTIVPHEYWGDRDKNPWKAD